MEVNLPYQVRAALYIILMVGSPIMIALLAWGRIDEIGIQLWLGLSTAIAVIAQLNISKGGDNGTVK